MNIVKLLNGAIIEVVVYIETFYIWVLFLKEWVIYNFPLTL